MASIECPTDYDLQAIARAAGATDPEQVTYQLGHLVVDGVSQAALEQAFATYSPVDDAKERKLLAINAAYEGEFSAIKQQYPEAERESWPIQLSEAAALADDALAPTPFLDALVLARGFGETKAELAAKVQGKNQAYSGLSAALTGKRHRLERQVQDATTPEQVQAITW